MGTRKTVAKRKFILPKMLQEQARSRTITTGRSASARYGNIRRGFSAVL
jgi:hypothetical protein